jgi:AraC family transcriptional regulator of adaptative response / DNA-3-methyladenine glycosylase II
LRRLSGDDVPVDESGEITLLLRYQPPYDWPAMLEFLRARAIPGIEQVAGDSYARTFNLDAIQGAVTVRPAPGNALRVSVRTPKVSILPKVIARLRRVFDLAADPLAIAAQLAVDPELAELVKRRPGLRVPGAWDGFELAIRAVLGQQITVPGAIRLAGLLIAKYGEPMPTIHGDLTHTFPQPQRLAAAKLASLGMPASRADTLSAVAAAVVADPNIFGAHRNLEEAVERLCSIRGVGEWTAQYIALRQLRETDAFPAADIGLMRALTDSNGRRPTARELLIRAEKWRPWRAYAAQHLWTSSMTESTRV